MFILGPSEWALTTPGPTPFEIRQALVSICHANGLDALLMEEVDDVPGEGLAEKFLRILDTTNIRNVLVIWPRRAKMPTTIAELVALRFRGIERSNPAIWLLVERGIITTTDGILHVTAPEGQVGYLRDLAKRGTELMEWHSLEDLQARVESLAISGFDP